MTTLRTRLLIVEDNADAAESLAGYDVRTAGDGKAAITASKQFSPHAVLLDLDLPDISGYEVCERIRAEPTALIPKIIVVSGHGLPDERKRVIQAGADDHAQTGKSGMALEGDRITDALMLLNAMLRGLERPLQLK